MKKVRMTEKRKLILNTIKTSPHPLSASQIYDILKDKGKEIWLSTIYRNMEIFEEAQMILRTDLPGSQENYYISLEKGHNHYGICMACHKTIDIKDCPLESYQPNLADKDFTIVDHRFMVYGYCGDCSSSGKKNKEIH